MRLFKRYKENPYHRGYRAGKVFGFKQGQKATELFYENLIKKTIDKKK
jgi:hypothetical protein